MQVVDKLPNGQGYISSTDPFAPGYSTGQILGVSLNPPPQPLDEAPFDWTHNQNDPAERITVKDHWFRVDTTTRLLNDPIDVSSAPNQHAAPSRNILTSTFDGVFMNPLTNQEEVYTFGPSTTGYPPEFRRRVDLTVTEPNIIVTKEVCNETDYRHRPGLQQLPAAGRTTAMRSTPTSSASRSRTRPPPMACRARRPMTSRCSATWIRATGSTSIRSMPTGSTTTATARSTRQAAKAGSCPTTYTQQWQTPAQIITAYDHSDALLRIDAGDSVTFYYRVDPDDRVAPQQQLIETAYATYDSLENDSGNQSDSAGRERRSRRRAPVHVRDQPRRRSRSSRSRCSRRRSCGSRTRRLSAPAMPQPVSIGEEIEFELRTLIPVARLRNFRICDELAGRHELRRCPGRRSRRAALRCGGFRAGRRLHADLYGRQRRAGISATSA